MLWIFSFQDCLGRLVNMLTTKMDKLHANTAVYCLALGFTVSQLMYASYSALADVEVKVTNMLLVLFFPISVALVSPQYPFENMN